MYNLAISDFETDLRFRHLIQFGKNGQNTMFVHT
jgi:hypothetical protein